MRNILTTTLLLVIITITLSVTGVKRTGEEAIFLHKALFSQFGEDRHITFRDWAEISVYKDGTMQISKNGILDPDSGVCDIGADGKMKVHPRDFSQLSPTERERRIEEKRSRFAVLISLMAEAYGFDEE